MTDEFASGALLSSKDNYKNVVNFLENLYNSDENKGNWNFQEWNHGKEVLYNFAGQGKVRLTEERKGIFLSADINPNLKRNIEKLCGLDIN